MGELTDTSASERRERSIDELRGSWNRTLEEILEQRLAAMPPDAKKPSPDEAELPTSLRLERLTRQALPDLEGGHQFAILSAPSGGGKGTVGKLLEERGFGRMPRFTTREPRPGEVNGADYFFVTREDFLERERAGEFLQTAETHGELRASSRVLLKEYFDAGRKFYVEGSAGAYLEFINHPDVKSTRHLSAFLLPPSFEVLEQRLRGRADTIDEIEIHERLAKAVEHLEKTKSYPYDAYYVNDRAERVADAIVQDSK
ncbi:MAG: hypothetical protein HYY51_02935 [Candidatus Magasanikbacteria bacterium]|nr:hypothetical protein [Candidatus Magasanikbacteria bacterium]